MLVKYPKTDYSERQPSKHHGIRKNPKTDNNEVNPPLNTRYRTVMADQNETAGEATQQSSRRDPQITGNVGLYYCCYRLRIPVLMDTQFGDVVRQFGATTAPTTSSNCG